MVASKCLVPVWNFKAALSWAHSMPGPRRGRLDGGDSVEEDGPPVNPSPLPQQSQAVKMSPQACVCVLG